MLKSVNIQLNYFIRSSTHHHQLRYAADTSSNEAASLVTRMDVLEAELTNRMLFFDIWFKKKINQDDACRLIDSVSPYYREYLKHKRLLAKHTLTEPEEKVISILDITGTSTHQNLRQNDEQL